MLDSHFIQYMVRWYQCNITSKTGSKLIDMGDTIVINVVIGFFDY